MKQQRGMTLIGAIFMLVIIAMLGQYLVNISGMQRQSNLLALQAARAYQTANAGIEWGAAQAIAGNCAANTLINIPNNNFTTNVDCTNISSYIEDIGPEVNVFLIQSQSEYGLPGNPDYVSRRIEATIQR
jgi:MSHA biogenesis protein MshP